MLFTADSRAYRSDSRLRPPKNNTTELIHPTPQKKYKNTVQSARYLHYNSLVLSLGVPTLLLYCRRNVNMHAHIERGYLYGKKKKKLEIRPKQKGGGETGGGNNKNWSVTHDPPPRTLKIPPTPPSPTRCIARLDRMHHQEKTKKQNKTKSGFGTSLHTFAVDASTTGCSLTYSYRLSKRHPRWQTTECRYGALATRTTAELLLVPFAGVRFQRPIPAPRLTS